MDTTEVGRPPARRPRKSIAWWGIAILAVALVGADGPAAGNEPVPAPSLSEGPLRVGGEVKPPVKVSGDGPIYTETARWARVTGVVILEAVIDARGTVTDTRILKGLPFGLDDAAVDAVKTWQFTPATLRGMPVPVYYILTVNFQLMTDFDFGPAFSAFMRNHADVRALVEESDYGEAGKLIDGFLAERGGDNSLLLGRAYMHLGERDVEKAWGLAQTITGPERAEIAQSIAAKAAELLWANHAAPIMEREKIAEVGVAASAVALELTDEGDEELESHVLRTRAELLRLQAALLSDPAQHDKLLDEARALDARADKLHPAGSKSE